MNLEQRFWDKVLFTPNCWEWGGYKLHNGYAGMRVNTQYKTTAHRVSYEIHKGKIPKNMEIDHICKNRGCVNPDHLQVVTHYDNMQRCDKTNVGLYNKIKTHCKRGHEFLEGSFWQYGTGRHCKKCNKIRYLDSKNKIR